VASTTSRPPFTTAHQRASTHRLAVLYGFLRRHSNWVAAGIFTLLAIAIYGATVKRTGFYYDDWAIQAGFHDANHSIAGLWHQCRGGETAGRPGGCVYHVVTYLVLGPHPSRYHALAVIFLAGSTFALFLLLRACRLPWLAAVVTSALVIIFPGSDATRLWPTAVGAMLILGLYFVGVLIAIKALRMGWGRRAAVLHGLSLLLFVALVFTYEIVIPLIAVDVIFYLLATGRNRPALVRGAVDFGFAVLITLLRLTVDKVNANSGFVVHRTLSQDVTRVKTLVRGCWQVWHQLFLSDTAAVIVAIVAALIVVGVAIARRDARRPIVTWLAVAIVGAFFVGVAISAYTTANDFYVPSVGGTFNRINIGAAPGHCLIFVALLGALFEALRRIVRTPAALAIVAVLVALISVHQLKINFDSQDAWAAAWQEEGQAMHGARAILPRIPTNASLVTFGHPLWERGFVPVFSASWDFRGAVDLETDHDPPRAVPYLTGVGCGPTDVLFGGAPYMPYNDPNSPTWFINVLSQKAVHVTSKRTCDATVAAFGPQPFWGKTVPGGL
jgi:hypothetical protein